jgi:hypothetical protein
MDKSSTKELSFVNYWDARYDAEGRGPLANETPYEWFRKFDQLRGFFATHLPPTVNVPSILQLGCGTSVSSSSHSLKGRRRLISPPCAVSYL